MKRNNTSILFAAAAGLVFSCGATAFAQQTAASPAAAPATQPADGVTLPHGKMLMNFHNASLRSVLTFLSQAGGLTVINDVNADGKINVINRHPMTLDEALGVLDTLLKDKGFAAVRMGKTLKIVPLDQAKQATIPVFTGNDPDKIKASDKIITQVIPVRFADANQLKTDLAALVPSYANFTANVSTNTLVLTDTAAHVQRMVRIIHSMDTAVSEVTRVKVFQLKYANASNAAKLITEIFQQDQNQGNARGGRFARFFRGRGRGQQNANEQGKPQAKVTAAADDRSNTVVVSAPGDVMPVIEEVLKELDENPAANQAVFIYHLKNAQAVDVQDVINSLFNPNAAGTTAGNTNANRNTGFTGPGAGVGGSSTFGGRSTGRTTSMGLGVNTNTNNSRTASAASHLPRRANAAAQSAADLAGQVYAVADVDTNSVLVMTGSNNFERVKAILAELDRPVPQVLIKVLIAEVTHTDSTDLGVEWSILDLPNNKSLLSTNFGVAAASGGLVYKLVTSDVSATLRALEQKGKLDVLSRPYILGSDNQTASILVGQTVPFITDSRLTDTGQTINTIQYQDVGIILNVTPHINPEGLVTMDVAPEISSQSDTTVPITAGVDAPVFNTRAAQTRVAIRDGQTIVIGGLMQDQKDDTVEKVPLLGDLPLIGALFRRTVNRKTKTELLIFLTPHVALEPRDLQAMSNDEKQGAVITPKAVGPGVFQKYMRDMQRGAATRPTKR